MSLTTTGGASMPAKPLRTRSTRMPARAPGLVVTEPVRVRAAGLGETHDFGAVELDRHRDGLDPLGHRPPPSSTSVSRPSRATLAWACIVSSQTSRW